jgi:iron complex transport system ATP-binding protein
VKNDGRENGSPAETGRPPLIEIRHATVWRGTTRVFERFSLTIGQGECVAILGPNGSGKTTLLKLVNRELYPVADEAGSVRILGRSRWNVWDLRRHIGLVSPDLQYGFLPSSSVLETILSGFFASIGVHAQLWDEVEPGQVERAEAVMEELGLGELRDRAFDTLSTGQQRRCLLGRALVHDPDTLILDEPTAGLDMAAGFHYLAEIRALVRRGRNLVLVTHHLDEIPPEVHRVVLLKAGNIVADGSKESVLTSERLSDVYDTAIRISVVDGHYLAYPGPAA